MDDKWFGLCCLDIFTPDHLKNRYKQINFGTLFEKLSVTENMLSEIQKTHCYTDKLKFPLNPQLLDSLNFIFTYMGNRYKSFIEESL